jgi:hypothetical protein
MSRPDADCGPDDDFAVEPPLPPEWLVRAEMRDLAHLAPDDPVRVRRLRALWAPAEPPER